MFYKITKPDGGIKCRWSTKGRSDATQKNKQEADWPGRWRGKKKVCSNINSACYAALTLVFSRLIKLKETKKKEQCGRKIKRQKNWKRGIKMIPQRAKLCYKRAGYPASIV